MADLNALIAQGAQFQAPVNPFVQYGQMQQLQQGQQQNQLNQMKMQEMQRSTQEQEGIRNYLKATPNVDLSNPEHQRGLLQIAPTLAQGMIEKAQLAQKTAAETKNLGLTGLETSAKTDKLAAETLDKNLENFNKSYSPISAAAAGPQGVQDYITAMYSHPILGSVAAKMKPLDAALKENLDAYQKDPSNWVAAHSQLNGQGILDTLKGTRQNVSLGGTNQGQTVNAYGQVVPGSAVSTPVTNTPFETARIPILQQQANAATSQANTSKSRLGISAIQADPYNISGVQAAFPIPGAAVAGTPSSTEKQPSGAPVVQNASAAMKAGLTGEDLLTHLPTSLASQIRAIGEGREPSPASRSLTTPAGRQLMDLVNAAYPTYDAKQYATMGTAEKAFTSGKKGDTTRSLNVAVDHLGTLQQVSDALQNGDTRLFNQAGNFIALQTGNPAPTDFNAVKRIVADEITKAVIGGAGALGDRKAVDEAISGANSPAQLKSVIDRYKQLMGGQLNGIEQQYTASTNKKDFRTRFLTPTTQAALGSGAAAPAVAGGVDTSNKWLK